VPIKQIMATSVLNLAGILGVAAVSSYHPKPLFLKFFSAATAKIEIAAKARSPAMCVGGAFIWLEDEHEHGCHRGAYQEAVAKGWQCPGGPMVESFWWTRSSTPGGRGANCLSCTSPSGFLEFLFDGLEFLREVIRGDAAL